MKEYLVPKGFSKMISDARKIREKADYGDFFRVSKDVAQKHLKNAEFFLSKSEIVLRNLLLKNNGK